MLQEGFGLRAKRLLRGYRWAEGRVSGCTAKLVAASGRLRWLKENGSCSGGFTPRTQVSAAEQRECKQDYGICASIQNVTPVGLPPTHKRVQRSNMCNRTKWTTTSTTNEVSGLKSSSCCSRGGAQRR